MFLDRIGADTPAARVGYLISQYPAINHVFVLREIRELRRLGIDVVAISVRRPDRPVAQLTPEEQDEAERCTAILGLPLRSILRMHARLLARHPLAWLRGLVAALVAGGGSMKACAWFAEAVVAGELFLAAGVDHFHVHFSSTVGLLITKMFRLRMSMTLHGPAEFLDARSFHLREKIEAAAFVRVISSFGSSQAMLAGRLCDWPHIEIVRLGVDAGTFRARHRQQAGQSVEFLCVARLNRIKGQHMLLEAMRELIDAGIPARLTLVGDGPDRESLQRHAARLGLDATVQFTGWINQDRLAAMYERADLFVLPSFAEGIPVVLMEAMAAELPVVATWVAGVPELIEHNHNGVLCPPGDRAALVSAILRLASDRVMRRRLGAAGRRTVLERYDLATNVRRLAECFTERRLLSEDWMLGAAEAPERLHALSACR
ncbi:MAG TPA: glycosyltransferase family 4 protein [Bryobacteraceae bacterium]|nr:glycosyltransferase family 4 protein [Bryobacteraceae bacterium]